MSNNLYTPLFILTDCVEENLETSYSLHELYTFLLRDPYHDNLHVLSAVRDLWCYFYFDEKELVLHPKINLIYSLRSMIVKIISTNEIMQRLKKSTVGLAAQSMLAAIKSMNLFIDILDIFYESLDQEMQHTLNSIISFDISKLFDQQFNLIEEYPSKFVGLQAAAIKAIRLFIVNHEEHYTESLMDISKSVRNYHLQYKQFFTCSNSTL